MNINSEYSFIRKINLPVGIGLFISLFGITLIGELVRKLNFQPDTYAAQILFSDFRKWILTGILIAIIFFWEKRNLSSIKILKPEVKTLLMAVGFGVISVVVGVLSLGIFYNVLELKQPEALSSVGNLPLIIKLITITTAAITEEIFYRGYAIERIGEITNNYKIGAVISGLIFIAIHYPAWGLAGAIPQIIFAIFLIGFYLYKRNLIACIVMHWVINFLMIVVVPSFL
jgi:membrane protease YdiL (CAAX protease family)